MVMGHLYFWVKLSDIICLQYKLIWDNCVLIQGRSIKERRAEQSRTRDPQMSSSSWRLVYMVNTLKPSSTMLVRATRAVSVGSEGFCAALAAWSWRHHVKRKCCKRCEVLYAKKTWRAKGGVWSISGFKLKPDRLPSVCFCSDDSVSRWGHRGATFNLKPGIYLPGNCCYPNHSLSSACNGRKIPQSGSV